MKENRNKSRIAFQTPVRRTILPGLSGTGRWDERCITEARLRRLEREAEHIEKYVESSRYRKVLDRILHDIE